MAVSSAPGKAYLFGEHAVVYGEPAIPCAIDRRTRVRVEPRTDGTIRIEAADLRFEGVVAEYEETLDRPSHLESPGSTLATALQYVDAALECACDTVAEPASGFDVRIESDLPIGAGLGSSAAVTVATIDAARKAMGADLERSDLADLGYQTEAAVQRGNASRADTFCSTMGGAVRVEGDRCETLDAPDLPIVVGFDGGSGNTARLVGAVRALVQSYAFGGQVIDAMGALTRAGEAALEAGDADELGRLMDVNHGLLSALGVSAPTIDRMVWAARQAGASGAKLTGAGGGGCIVALGDSEDIQTALRATPVCEQAFRTSIDRDGIRTEESL